MRKLRKMFTSLFTAAVICGMALTPTFAAGEEKSDPTTGSTAITGVTFTKEFVSENGGILPDETFHFTMTPDDNADGKGKTDDGLTIKRGLDLGKNATADLTFGADRSATQNGTFSFSGITFDGPAVYRYIIKEVKPENANPNITYDETSYTVDVMVDNTDTPVAVLNVGAEGSTSLAKKPVLFTNHCATDELVITKSVTGAMGDKDKLFDFTIDIPSSGDNIKLASGTKISGVIYRKNSSTDPVEFTVGGENNFSLADTEKLVISNVPEGMIYTVTEASYEDYQTSIVGTTSTGNTKVTKNVTGNTYDASENGQNTPIVNGGNTIAFTNHKEVIRTGISLDVIPYAVGLVLLVILGIAAFWHTAKRSDR